MNFIWNTGDPDVAFAEQPNQVAPPAGLANLYSCARAWARDMASADGTRWGLVNAVVRSLSITNAGQAVKITDLDSAHGLELVSAIKAKAYSGAWMKSQHKQYPHPTNGPG